MTQEEFKAFYFCEFKVDKRLAELQNRVDQYFIDTHDIVLNSHCIAIKRNLLSWAEDSGYSREELTRAKRNSV